MKKGEKKRHKNVENNRRPEKWREENKELRNVTIEGKWENIFEAIKKVMVCVERMAIKNKDRKIEDKTTTKFVFPEKSMGFMIGKHGSFI